MTLEIFALIWFCVNLLAFFVYGFDKLAATNGWFRVRESRLLMLALLGGLGAMSAITTFRHKTRKQPFRSQAEFAVLAHVIASGLITVWLWTA